MKRPSLLALAAAGLAVVVLTRAVVTIWPALDQLSPRAFAEAAVPMDAEDAAPQTCRASDDMVAAIAEERALLTEQQSDLADREAEVRLAEESLKAESARLAALRDEVEAQMRKVEEAFNQDVSKLVDIYRGMKPAVAAGIMNDLDLETTVLVITAMAERDAALILGALNVDRARLVSRIILDRARLPGDQGG